MDSHRHTQWSKIAGPILMGMMLFTGVATAVNREGCEDRMHNCTESVRPFLHDLEYMFPTNLQHIDNMCRLWSGFVDCIRLYVKDCASEDQRSRFNDAVEDSINTVHAICSSDRYQKEYLQSASCFRKVSVDNCGSHYNDMVDEASQAANGASDNICCSYSKFRSCVSEPLLRLCGSRARTIMDHSMAFLIHRCPGNSYSLSHECPKSKSRSVFTDDRPVVVSSASVGSGTTSDSSRSGAQNNDIRHRHATFRSEHGPKDENDYYNRRTSGSAEDSVARQAAASSGSGPTYRSTNQYRYNHGPSDRYRSSSTFASSPTFTSSTGEFSDQNPDSKRGGHATARSQRPAPSASSRLLRDFNENGSSGATPPNSGGRLSLFGNTILILILSLSII